MITPVLDLQGASQLIDRTGLETAPVDGSSGDFGAAFTASLSTTPSAAGSAGSKEFVVATGQRQATPSQLGGTAQTTVAKTSATTNKSSQTTAGQKVGVGTRIQFRDDAGDESVESLQRASGLVAAAVATKSTDLPVAADKSISSKAGAQVATEASDSLDFLAEAQKIAVAGIKSSSYRLAGSELQELQAGGTGTAKQVTAKTSQSGFKVDGSQTAEKSKASGQVSDQVASQPLLPATSLITSDLLVASLAAGASGSHSSKTATASKAQVESITAASGASSADLSGQSVQRHLGATNVDAPKTVASLQGGESGGKSGVVAAWGSVEPTIVAAASGAVSKGRQLPVETPQVEPAVHAQSVPETPDSALSNAALPTGVLPHNLNRSTAILAPTELTVSGEQRVSPVTHDLTGDGSGTRSGLAGVSHLAPVSAGVSANGSQPVVTASTTSLAANVHSELATSSSTAVKTTGEVASTHSFATSASHAATPTSGVSGRPVAPLEPSGAIRPVPKGTEAETVSQDPPVVPGAVSELRHSVRASLDLKSASAQALSGATAAAGTVSGTPPPASRAASATERAKAVGASGAAAAQAATSLSSKDNNDHGVSSDSSDNLASVGTGGSAVVAIANHVTPHEVFNAAGGGVATVSALSSQGVPQGTGVAAISTTAPVRGALSGQGSLGVTAAPELGHPASALRTAIGSEPHQTLEATPTSLEVGVHSGTEGWLKIRAEVGGEGQVSASLAATSASGDQMLKGQLPALNAYLHSEQMSVTASVAERTGIAHGAATHDAGGAALQAGTGSSSGQNASLLHSGGNPGMAGHGSRSQGDAPGTAPVQSHSAGDGQTGFEAGYDRGAVSDTSALPSTVADSSGQWLNVRV
ncbi:hypothetical protein HDF16_002329 [Granulicella aggregans]|uniref:Flagellar hook-length control protein FliK n=1 Tax=Granulicella aggregans TaxID=474949 RepID=A0A7W7ZD22_9BACT|nr:hypothetical protein [Granulicella aggregans]MBB5057623.1 hypothetical protein [Granulicella aggregans]